MTEIKRKQGWKWQLEGEMKSSFDWKQKLQEQMRVIAAPSKKLYLNSNCILNWAT